MTRVHSTLLCWFASSCLAVVACKGKENDGGKSAPIDIPALGLKADAPGGSKVSAMGESQMVQGPDLVVSVEAAKDTSPKTLADAKSELDMYSPQNLKEETLPDGWAITFSNKGGMGTNYWVKARREIGGKAYLCDTTSNSEGQQKNALAFCKSLRQ